MNTPSPLNIPDVQRFVAAVEDRARSLDLSINDLCRTAGVSRATWQRWKAGTVSPKLGGMTAVNNALALTEMRKVLR